MGQPKVALPLLHQHALRALVDPFGRSISYLRVSVTDRCNLRCSYCMPERMQFLSHSQVLPLRDLERLIRAFIRRGVRKVRLTGGEPLARKGIDSLIARIGGDVRAGKLDELTLTTNGTQLAAHARSLFEAGVRRVNVSLDTLRPEVFERIARRPALESVCEGVDAAQSAGLGVKINTVALKDVNVDEIPTIIEWAHARGIDVSVIEVMPLGDIGEDRLDQYVPLTVVRERLDARWTLTPIAYRTGGPSRYFKVEETGGRLGFITPLTQNFCEGCNRVRLTCTGKLFLCLGQSEAADFAPLLRAGTDDDALDDALDEAISRKPRGHDFRIEKRCSAPSLARHMSVTGG